MQFVDFFAGIGGIRLGLEQAGHKCVGFCEFDKYARTAYKAMYDTEGEWENHDVRTVKPYDVPAADLWCFGFPCQDINVKNLLSIGNGFDFARLLVEVGKHGYSLQWDTLNSKDFGVPQNRERVFIVGYLGNISGREVFPLRPADGENPCELNEITQGVADAQRIYDGSGLARTLKGESGGQGGKTGLYAVKVLKPYGSTGGICGLKIAENKTGIAATCVARDYKGISRDNGNAVLVAPVLTPDRTEKRQNGRRIKEPGEPSFTLTAQDRHGVAMLGDNVRIRRLTPRECWRLQGFPDEYFDKAKAAGISDTQLYKQAGNGVTVNVARAIGERLKEVEEWKPKE